MHVKTFNEMLEWINKLSKDDYILVDNDKKKILELLQAIEKTTWYVWGNDESK